MSYLISKKLSVEAASRIEDLISQYEGENWATNYIKHHQYRCFDDVTNIYNLSPNGRVLNIGGAPYVFEALAQTKDLKVVSVDLNPGRHSKIVNAIGIDVIQADIEDPGSRVNLRLADFDVIALCEVFEHMRFDLIGTLKFLKEEMNGNATLYLTTPNFYFFRSFIGMLLARRSGPSLVSEWRKLEDLGHMGHVREYSKTELIELFEYVEFDVKRSKLRNRTSVVSKKRLKGFLKTLVFTIFERSMDLFAQEFIFELRKKP